MLPELPTPKHGVMCSQYCGGCVFVCVIIAMCVGGVHAFSQDMEAPLKQIALFAQIRGLIEATSDVGAAQIDALVFAARDALPYIVGVGGTCSQPCQDASIWLIERGLGIAEQLVEGLTFNAAAKQAVPSAFITCECGVNDADSTLLAENQEL